jgi:hypothetical protein
MPLHACGTRQSCIGVNLSKFSGLLQFAFMCNVRLRTERNYVPKIFYLSVFVKEMLCLSYELYNKF